eukprot:761528-Hanusia_phi.AAC.1
MDTRAMFLTRLQAVKANARRLGGSFAVWGGLFSTFDCCFIAIRSKEDPYNSIMSGFCTGAVLASRGGVSNLTLCYAVVRMEQASAAMKAGFVGGVILAVIEGLNVAITRIMNNLPQEPVGPPPKGSEAQQIPVLNHRHFDC